MNIDRRWLLCEQARLFDVSASDTTSRPNVDAGSNERSANGFGVHSKHLGDDSE
jgi:hypothetical protein